MERRRKSRGETPCASSGLGYGGTPKDRAKYVRINFRLRKRAQKAGLGRRVS